ncbi:TPA: cytochrome b [Serratia fonticola]|uniref:Cytochrome b561 homolog 2 n=1 Tax=Serratia fonticola TaxID=47917 RepID=A0A3S5AQY5_SERFO|nr:cytochrome b [Serratia fonticola]CAI0697457.1 Cytochrome b561 homolog 2 [Serratia fonticola]CAI0698887.1 Cytochrome b561 homolog 2 [Serratia fonticola]CAI1525417.1 Cytochrome b561 homolog 2 [Serratia fonticola]VEI68726.1 Cytochrome b561 homolog 2 [Serratia fonticola]
MLWKNTADRFGHVSVLIHWLVALTVYGMFALGLWMVTLGYYDVWYHQAPEIHKSIGTLLFIVMVVRVVWRFISPPPKPLASYSRLTRISAVLAHIALYTVLFAILISGYLISTADGQAISVFSWFDVPASVTGLPQQADTAGTIHLYLAWAVVVLSVLHALAALKHHFIDRDVTLKRMLGRSTD